MKDILLNHKEEFEIIIGIISAHKKRAMYAVHNESLNMLWEVGAYVSERLNKAAWGDGVVRMLAEYIHTRSPKAKGWSYRTIYKMVQFYETYSSQGFNEIVHHYGMQHYLSKSDQRELPDEKKTIVPIELAQIGNHQLIMSRCKSDEQRLFYMLYAGREQLEYKELQRALKTDAMSSILGSKDVQSEMMKREYPQSGVLFKDTVYLEMFGLPVKYKESKLRKEIIAQPSPDYLGINNSQRIKTMTTDNGIGYERI